MVRRLWYILPLWAVLAISAWAQADSTLADMREEHLDMMQRYLVRGCELQLKGRYRAAVREFEEGIAICERLRLQEYCGSKHSHEIFSVTVPLYAMSASIYCNLGDTDEAVRTCRKAMKWIELWDDIKEREPYVFALGLTMMEHDGLEITRDLLVRAYKDATLLELHDDALMCAACLMEIDDALYATRPKDNPWIARGKIHYEGAVNEEHKVLFLSLLGKAYKKASLLDKAKRLDKKGGS